ncbi:DUF2125 domain-containing protein [Paracoccus sp. (in: a-proteobacteria)]|uniref:DUF2125 domain-containing protein n=1 Tax=Paracoccus sp. TaxID=267 RepID=UPI0035AE0C08
MIGKLLLTGVLGLAGLWFAAEPLLVAQARRHVQAETVAAQPGAGRLGLAMTGLVIPARQGQVDLPALDLWLTPAAPTTIRLSLPPEAVLQGAAGNRVVGMDRATGAVTLSPLGRVTQARAGFAALSLDGRPFAEEGGMTAERVSDDRLAGHPYQVQVALPRLHLPQVSSARGGLRLWLDRPLAATTQQPPAVLGVASEDFEVDAGAFALRLAGQLSKGGDGRTQGRVAIYSSDAAAMLEAAIEAGLMPPNVRLLARAMLNRIGQMEFDGGDAGLPPAPDGQVRIPLEMRDGRMYLGTIEIGAAPAWPIP